MVYVIMGVSGVGKTLVGSELALRLGLPFYDADNFHPAANVTKMSKGVPLTDEDREPWLGTLNAAIRKWNQEGGAILACSALRKRYRTKLAKDNRITFIMLRADREVILDRMKNRKGHYMPPSLLDSQIEALEDIDHQYIVDNSGDKEIAVEEILNLIRNEKLNLG